MTTALLLIAHGSRRAEANAVLEHFADALRRRGPYPIVEIAFLELATPTIAEGGARCAAAGAERILMLPFFLSGGVHVREDLEAARQEMAGRHGVPVLLAEPLGRHPLLVDILLERARQAETESG